MDFLTPGFALLAAGVTAPLLLVLYMLKRRRRRVVISSTLLWRKAVEDLQANAPFQWFRRNLLLLLQLLVLSGVLLALAGPVIHAAARPGQRVILVIDHSGSMNATDVSPTRLAEAKSQAIGLIDQLGDGFGADAGSGVMVISFAHNARVVEPFTADRARLREAVESIAPTDQPSRLEPALRLIEPFARRDTAEGSGDSVVVYLFSDGRVEEPRGVVMPQVAVRYVKIGSGSENLGVVGLAARRGLEDSQRVSVLARLANYSAATIATNLTLQIDGRAHRVLPVTVPGRDPAGQAGTQTVGFELGLGSTAVVGVSHDYDDRLAADNSAWLVLAAASGARILLVTEGNGFLEQALAAAGPGRLAVVTPEAYERQGAVHFERTGETGVDLIVFDRYAPGHVPGINALYFQAVPPVEGLQLWVSGSGASESQLMVDWDREHPLMRHVVLDDLLMVEPGRLVLPDTAQSLATAQAGPVIAAVFANGANHVVVGFDLRASNWPMQVGFPVFISNAVGWLGLGRRHETGLVFRPGQGATIPLGGMVRSLRYAGPVEIEARLLAGGMGSAQAVLPVFERVGLYEAQQAVGEPWDWLAVSMLDAHESDVGPRDTFRLESSGGGGVQAEAGRVRQEVWPWLVSAALGVLVLEWVVYLRRVGR